jgi:hypothetical protein
MANQITIDIVAETKKLTSGINDANGQIDGMSKKLKGAAAAAGAAASAFVLKQGITFLKQGIDEAKEAQEVMRAATSTFGEGSVALQKITEDADKFGKVLAVDNDELIALATQLGSRLPANIQSSSVELVKLFKDVEAFTAGAVTAEGAGNKLAKAFADGKLKATELTKVFPGLEQSVYAQAEALSAAGDNQAALNLLVESGSKKYDDAAAKNATSTQKFEVALANFKEVLGTKVLPILEKAIDFLTKLIGVFDGLPGPVQNIILGLVGLLAIGVPLLTFLASAKTAMAVLNITTLAFPGFWLIAAIVAVIAAVVLLVKNWDKVTEVFSRVFEATKEFGSKIKSFISDIVNKFQELPTQMLNVGKNIVMGLWNGMQNMAGWLKDRVTGFFKNLIPSWAEKALGISSPSKVFASIGKNIVSGLTSTFNAPAIKSVSNRAQTGMSFPSLSYLSLTPRTSTGTNITINAGLGTNGAELGRQVSSAIRQYGKVSTRAR